MSHRRWHSGPSHRQNRRVCWAARDRVALFRRTDGRPGSERKGRTECVEFSWFSLRRKIGFVLSNDKQSGRRLDATKPGVRAAAIGRALASAAYEVARTIPITAQKRTALLYPLRDAGLLWIIAVLRPLGIARRPLRR